MRFSNLRSRLVSGSLWAIVGEVIAGGARALSSLVYAKLLSPTDFGLIGFALLLINFFPLVVDNSLSLALMRQPQDDQRAYSTIFYLNVALSLAAILILFLVAPGAARVLHDQRVTVIIPVLGIQLLFNALCSVHIAAARRQFRYRRLVPVRLISTVCSLGLGIPLAFLGYSYWSLLVASIAAALSQMVAAQVLLGWRPALRFDWAAAKDFSGFASWVAVDMGVTWMVMSGGGFFLAYFLGAHDLGLFQLSDRIDTYILGSLLGPLIPVLYAGFCEVSDSGGSWRLFERSIAVLTPISLAVAGAIVVAARPLEALFGAKWHGVADVMALNAIADGISYTILPAPSLLRAHGLAKIVAAMRLVTVAAQVVVYMRVAPHGLVPFMYGKMGLEIAIYAGSLLVLRMVFKQPVIRTMGRQLGQLVIIAICAAMGVVAAAGSLSLGPPVALSVGLAIFAIPLGAYLYLTQRELLTSVLERRIAAK
ncbi:MAG TPA: oligosaccharide flippase family protein [Steroidobacteraceae bacterium]|nr:oligosaccharide flippase family protein [Steroidobacteraceae bacterium]